MRFVAGGGAAAKLQTSLGAAAESHREDAASRGHCGRAAGRPVRNGEEACRERRSGKEAAGGGRCGRVGGAGEEWQWQGNAAGD